MSALPDRTGGRRTPREVVRLLLAASVLTPAAGCGRLAVSGLAHADQLKAASERALFQDVATSAGIRFTHTSGATGRYYFIENTPAGCAFLDYDNDGFLDIVLAQSGDSGPGIGRAKRPTCALYHNNRDGTFTDVSAGSGLDRDLGYAQGIAVGDVDNDGYDDLFITGLGRNCLLHNEHGTGKFSDRTTEWSLDRVSGSGYATSAAFGDYDNDGRLDLYVCYYCRWDWKDDKPCTDSDGRRGILHARAL